MFILIGILFLPMSLGFFWLSRLYTNPYLLLVAIICIFIFNLGYGMRNIAKNSGFILYNLLLMLFLTLRSIVRPILGVPLEDWYSDFQVFKYLSLLYLVYLGLFIGTMMPVYINKYSNSNSRYIDSSANINFTRAAKIIFYCALPFHLFILFLKIRLVFTSGYMAYYLEYFSTVSRIPFIVIKMADLYFPSFLIMLATMPKFKYIKIEVIIFYSTSILSVLRGQRNEFALITIFLIWYLSYREFKGINNKKYINMKYFIFACLSLLIFIQILSFVGTIRIGYDRNTPTESSKVLTFLDEFGSSNHVTLNSFIIEHGINENEKYRFILYPFSSFFNNNTLSQLLFGTKVYRPQTPEYANNVFSFGDYQTYKLDPNLYVSGGSFGTSFLAEAYLAGGYLGVILISVFYGYFLRKTETLKIVNWIYNFIYFNMIYYLLYTPRYYAFYWVTSSINITNGAVLLFVYLIGNQMNIRRGKKNENTSDICTSINR